MEQCRANSLTQPHAQGDQNPGKCFLLWAPTPGTWAREGTRAAGTVASTVPSTHSAWLTDAIVAIAGSKVQGGATLVISRTGVDAILQQLLH